MMFKKILVPTDSSTLSEKAIYAAVEFARTNGSERVALSVAEPYVFSPYEEIIQAANEFNCDVNSH